MSSAVNLYEVLAIQQVASQEEVRKAFRQKALETHPDKLSPTANEEAKRLAEAKFREVLLAFETLSDPQRRLDHDATLRAPPDLRASSARFEEIQAQRMRERAEWARQSAERHAAHMARLRARRAEAEEQRWEAMGQPELVEEMLKELYRMTPELELRKQRVERRKVQRAETR